MELMTAPGARLENEVTMYLQSELSRIVNANEVFEAMARGYSRYSDILAQSHVSSSPTLADVLDRLIRMEVVAKEAPINDEGSRKKAGYYISDNMSLFFYRYLFRYASQRNVMAPEAFYEHFVSEDFETYYVPKRFEQICRQYLIRRNRMGRMEEPFFRIGKYYYDLPKEHRNGEFDVVTEDARGYIFYEAKFQKSPVSQSVVEEEIRQVKETGLSCYRYGFFSRSGFQKEVKDPDIICISLDEMYEQ